MQQLLLYHRWAALTGAVAGSSSCMQLCTWKFMGCGMHSQQTGSVVWRTCAGQQQLVSVSECEWAAAHRNTQRASIDSNACMCGCIGGTQLMWLI